MIPILYSGDEIAFTSNGLGRLADCVECAVTEERNGQYECEFVLPVTSSMYPIIAEGMIVGVTHDDRGDVQPFDIYARTAPLDGLVTFYARHISYRLRNIILRPYTAGSCAEALAAMPANSYNPNPFTFWTSKATVGQWAVTVPSACKAVLMGQQGSILDVYGTGEYEWDKWAVKLHTRRGADNGVSIRYGYNLSEFTRNIDDGDSYTAVAPFWKATEGDEVVTLPEGIVTVSREQKRLYPWTTETGEVITNEIGEPIEFQVSEIAPVRQKTYPWTTESGEEITTEDGEPIEFQVAEIIPVPMDLSQDFETKPTPDQLRQRAIQRLNSSEAWLPSDNIKVSFVDLAHTEDYKDVAALQRVSLCDYVSVYCGPLGVSAVSMKVIRTVWNVLEERYNEVEIGSPRPTYADTIMAQVDSAIDELAASVVSVDVLQSAVANATAQITGANGGHIRDIYNANGDRMEQVIIDTMDIATATKVWRWNLGGLGYSRNGYDGPYTTAITQDGHIVADFVDTGTLNANIIGAHTIAVDKLTGSITNNGWELNLAAGTFTIGNISANNINAGTLSVDRIGANSIGFAKLTGTIDGGDNWSINLATGTMTIGNISANNITTGTMSAARIQGGDLILGGVNHAFGRLLLKDSSDVTVTTLDETGLTINKGAISLGGNFTVTSGGILTCSGASINGTLRTISGDYKAEMANGKLLLSDGSTVVGQLQWQGPKQMYAMPSSASLQGTGAVSLYAANYRNYPYGIHVNTDGTMTFHCKTIHIDATEDAVTADSNTISPMVRVKGVGKDYVFYFTNGMLTAFEEETPQ